MSFPVSKPGQCNICRGGNHPALVKGHLYYKRVDPYLWTELAPVLECSVSRRQHQRKGTSADRICVVFVARVDRRIFLLFVKNGFVVEGAFAEGNTASLKQHRLLL